jgi:hypothetical protein
MSTRKNQVWIWLYCFFTAAVCLAICSKSSFLYPINDWSDANAYFTCGKGMLAGRVIYRDLYEHKGPLLYALHALCCLIDDRSFLGVFIMEILCAGLFLRAAYNILILYGAKRSALLWLPVIAGLVYASLSFQQGDSAEELCLPMLAWSLYGALAWLRSDAPRRMKAGTLLLNGFLAGCVLWVKFTMLGFYAAWLIFVMVFHIARREPKAAFMALGWFAAGAVLATTPWLLYFGLNGAILPWLKTYLYDNLFLYQDDAVLTLAARCKAMLRAGWDWFAGNWGYAAPTVLGLGWLTLRRHGHTAEGEKTGEVPWSTVAEKVFCWVALGVLALGVFIGGKSYLYYGLILAVFAPLGALPLIALAERMLARIRVRGVVALACTLALGAGGFTLAASSNTPDLLKPRDQTMQYRFAAIVQQTPGATLLNYGFMDAGFYTACHIVPNVKYFHQTNVHLQEMLDEQARYIAEGVTDYVVTRGKQPDTIGERYDLVATEKTPEGFWYEYVYLYRLKSLAP